MANALTWALMFGVVVAASACSSDTPAQPSFNPRDPSTVLRAPLCAPVQSAVRCTVTMWSRGSGDADVTTLATWSVSDKPFSASPATIATVSSPGVVTPIHAGDIYIRVDYVAMSTVAPHSYRMTPNATAVPLAPYLTGFVSEINGAMPIGGVLIEILDGDSAGKIDETRVNGAYFINHMSMGVPFTARASKPGYAPSVQTHPGITDGSTGFPANNFLHFRLERTPAS